jgi:hypothetical protein
MRPRGPPSNPHGVSHSNGSPHGNSSPKACAMGQASSGIDADADVAERNTAEAPA